MLWLCSGKGRGGTVRERRGGGRRMRRRRRQQREQEVKQDGRSWEGKRMVTVHKGRSDKEEYKEERCEGCTGLNDATQ